jgi:hypothetical protein
MLASLHDNPATVLEPTPHPPACPSHHIDVSTIPAIMVSSPVLAVSSIPLSPPSAYKRTRPRPVFATQLRPPPTALLPEPFKRAPPCSLHRSGELPSPSLAIFRSIKLCQELRHTLTFTTHHFPHSIVAGNLTGGFTAAGTRHRAADWPP